MRDHIWWKQLHWFEYGAELLGTAILVFAGVSAVVVDFGTRVCDHSPSLRALLPEATADLLRSRACFLPDTARKMVARLETTLSGNRAYGQSCLFEHFDPLCYSLLPKIGDGRQRYILSKEAYQRKGLTAEACAICWSVMGS